MARQDGCSGKFLVRIPPFLHERLIKVADDQGISLNTLVQTCLAESVTRLAAERRISKMQKRIEVKKDE